MQLATGRISNDKSARVYLIGVRRLVFTAALDGTNPHWDCNQDPNFRIVVTQQLGQLAIATHESAYRQNLSQRSAWIIPGFPITPRSSQ